MIGLELEINGVTKRASLGNGVVSIIINRIKLPQKDQIDLSFSGLNMDNQENITWLKSDLTESDKLKIEIKDVEMNSIPDSVEKLSRENSILEGKLKAYHALKKELEDKGVI